MKKPDLITKLLLTLIIIIGGYFGYNITVKDSNNNPIELSIPVMNSNIVLVDSTGTSILTVDSTGYIHINSDLKNKAIRELLIQTLAFRDSFYRVSSKYILAEEILKHVSTTGVITNKESFDTAVYRFINFK